MTCECVAELWCNHKPDGTKIIGDFWFLADGRKYHYDKPSMTVAEAKAISNVSIGYQTFLEQPDDKPDIGLCDAQAIDLRAHCSLYFVPPATFG